MRERKLYSQKVKDEVIRLAKNGLSNRQISSRVGPSPRTIGEWVSYELDSPWRHGYCEQCGEGMSWRVHPLHKTRTYNRCHVCAERFHRALRDPEIERILKQQGMVRVLH